MVGKDFYGSGWLLWKWFFVTPFRNTSNMLKALHRSSSYFLEYYKVEVRKPWNQVLAIKPFHEELLTHGKNVTDIILLSWQKMIKIFLSVYFVWIGFEDLWAEVHSEPSQISKTRIFAKVIKPFYATDLFWYSLKT